MLVGIKFCIFGPIYKNINHWYIPARNSPLKQECTHDFASGGGGGFVISAHEACAKFLPYCVQDLKKQQYTAIVSQFLFYATIIKLGI
jgi:hypothetical protein